MRDLWPDDRDLLDDLIEETEGSLPTGERRDLVIERLIDMAEQYESDNSAEAKRILYWAAGYGVRDRITQQMRSPQVLVKIGETTVQRSKNYAVRAMNRYTGERDKPRQMALLDLPWELFLETQVGIRHQADAMAFTAQMYSRIAHLRTKYPNAKTPREACTLEGIDPDTMLQFETDVRELVS